MDLQTLQLKQSKIMHDAQSLLNVAEKEERKLTDDEEKSYEGFLKSLEGVEKQIAKAKSDGEFMSALNKITNGDGNPPGTRQFLISGVSHAKSWGQQFVASKAYESAKQLKATRSGIWTTEAMELVPFKAATLTEDPASGGALVVPDYQPGIIPGPIQKIVVADLFAPGTTNSNSVPTMVETDFTNNADTVAEGAAKPESALTFTSVAEPVRKIAHWIPVSEELLEDAPATASYIDGRLRYGLLRVEDYQLLFGSGVAPDVTGLLVRAGLAAPIARVDPATNADAILKQIVAIEAATGYTVTGIVMNPQNWGAVIGAKDTTGVYISAGGPFTSPAGPTLWGRQVALTDQMTLGEAVVGAFKSAGQVFRRGPIRLDASNSHQDFFVRNLVALRSEERLALAVYRAAAFGKVTGLTTL